MSANPSDREVIEALRVQGGPEVAGITRRPYRYATSAPLEEVTVHFADGDAIGAVLKDLDRERLIGQARAAKPRFLDEPRRELETYRGILVPAGVGPRLLAAVAEEQPRRHWLLIEKVPGVELWQIGELEMWETVAAWLARFHAQWEDRIAEIQDANPHVLDLSEAWFESWAERAEVALERSGDPRACRLVAALAGYDEVIGSLAGLPRTFVHGELYPSNVIVVRGAEPRVCPVDWEMAAIGPGLIDLAALVGGWDDEQRGRLIAAYLRGQSESGKRVPDADELAADLARCRLHLALQWLAWSPQWSPPREHAHDWLGEALALARDLELA